MASGGYRFSVWAPRAQSIQLRILGPSDSRIPLSPSGNGYFEAVVETAAPGMRYFYQMEDRDFPDPASRFQPESVHGPSELVESGFAWQDEAWLGLPLEQFVLYELHVGAFAYEGTFDAVIPHLKGLRDLGITAIELMPIAQFPGDRNWGYDGVSLFAAHSAYGGPEGLKRLVNACHQHGLAVVLDVVYNHLGPEGNYLSAFGPYFTAQYQTPWGSAVNFDGPDSDEVRRYFTENALYWICDCHVDALRLDAVHAIHDESAVPFLEELGEAVHTAAAERMRKAYVIAESDLNDSRIVRSRELGGMELDAQWNDDFHHALVSLLTGERSGYYMDFGDLHSLAEAYREGYVYSGQHSAYRRRRHGNSSASLAAKQFVVFSQNHDQVGNRMLGERLSALVSHEQLKLAAGAVLLSPFIPLLFMGEEYGETAPFLYFVSHSDPGLIQAVREGRQREFEAFAWQGRPPDPQDEATFVQSKLNHEFKRKPAHEVLFQFYRELLRLRASHPALAHLSKQHMEVTVYAREQVLSLRRWHSDKEVLVLLCFSPSAVHVQPGIADGRWKRLLNSSDPQWLGPGGGVAEWLPHQDKALQLQPNSVLLLEREADEQRA